jgi:hypothetical protein
MDLDLPMLEEQVMMSAQSVVGHEITRVEAHYGPWSRAARMRGLSFSNGIRIGLSSDMGAPILLPDDPSYVTLELGRAGQAQNPWSVLVGRHLTSVAKRRGGLVLRWRGGEARFCHQDLECLVKRDGSEQLWHYAAARLIGQVLREVFLVFEPSGEGAPTEARLVLDADGEVILRRVRGGGIELRASETGLDV